MDGTGLINLDYSYTTTNVNGMSTANSNISLNALNLNSQSTSQAMDALEASYNSLKDEIEVYKQILATDISNVLLACNTLQDADDTANTNVNTYLGTAAGSTPPFAPYATQTGAPYATTPLAPFASATPMSTPNQTGN